MAWLVISVLVFPFMVYFSVKLAVVAFYSGKRLSERQEKRNHGENQT